MWMAQGEERVPEKWRGNRSEVRRRLWCGRKVLSEHEAELVGIKSGWDILSQTELGWWYRRDQFLISLIW
jgi:hypothetical protein